MGANPKQEDFMPDERSVSYVQSAYTPDEGPLGTTVRMLIIWAVGIILAIWLLPQLFCHLVFHFLAANFT